MLRRKILVLLMAEKTPEGVKLTQAERAKVEAREALARYDATGEYVANEDVQGWLATWGTPDERPSPAQSRRARSR